MNISIKTTNYQLGADVENLITDKLGSCAKYLGEGADTALLEVEVGRIEKHQTGPVYRVEANLSTNGKLYRAEATEETIESAAEATREELQREIKKDKGRARRYLKKGGAMLKSMLRFGK